MSQFKGSQAERILPYPGEGLLLCSIQACYGLGSVPPTLGRAASFTQTTNLNVNTIPKHRKRSE